MNWEYTERVSGTRRRKRYCTMKRLGICLELKVTRVRRAGLLLGSEVWIVAGWFDSNTGREASEHESCRIRGNSQNLENTSSA